MVLREIGFSFWDTSERVIEQAGDAGIHKDMQHQLHVVRVVFLARSADLLGFCIFDTSETVIEESSRCREPQGHATSIARCTSGIPGAFNWLGVGLSHSAHHRNFVSVSLTAQN